MNDLPAEPGGDFFCHTADLKDLGLLAEHLR
jgi:hypothetical protein